MAPFWDDLTAYAHSIPTDNFGSVHAYITGTAPSRYAVIEYHDFVIDDGTIPYPTPTITPSPTPTRTPGPSGRSQAGVRPMALGKPLTFEVILYENGDIVFQYLTLADPALDGATVGIESPAGNDGLQYTYNGNPRSVYDGLAIKFAHPAPSGWPDAGPDGRDLPPTPANPVISSWRWGTVATPVPTRSI